MLVCSYKNALEGCSIGGKRNIKAQNVDLAFSAQAVWMCQPVFKEHEKLPQTESCQRGTGLLLPALELVGHLLRVALQFELNKEKHAGPEQYPCCVLKEVRVCEERDVNLCSPGRTSCHATLWPGGAGQIDSLRQAGPREPTGYSLKPEKVIATADVLHQIPAPETSFQVIWIFCWIKLNWIGQPL